MSDKVLKRAGRFLLSAIGAGVVTWVAYRVVPVNATTAGFAYLLLVLVVASVWGFLEAAVTSILATLALNFYFLPPVHTLTIADPQNWVALFSFLATSLVASRLSTKAKRRAADAMERQQDLERLYAFSRAILLIGADQPFAKQLAQKLAETFDLNMVMLYDRQNDEIHRAGPANCEGIEEQLREAALQGTSFQDVGCARVITAVRLGSDPIASIALQGAAMPDSVLQGIANLVAIGLERARAQELAREMETTRQTERLRTALIDAMAHEFKTPLTSIKAATTSLLANPNDPEERRTQILKIADDEADHLRELIDDALEMARLEATDIDIQAQPSDLGEMVREVIAALRASIDGRIIEISADPKTPQVLLDRRLIKLAIKQLVDNALKYSPPDLPVQLRIEGSEEGVRLEITDRGPGIPKQEQQRIFQRFHRVSSSETVPGLGLGLSIAQRIVESHRGNLTLTSEPGRTTFRLTLPADQGGTPS